LHSKDLKIEDIFSQYEAIDENNMEPMQVIEKVEATVNPRTSSVSSNSVGIKFDSICLTVISPMKSLSHSILASGCVVASYSCEDTIFGVQYLCKISD
jgi:hypothetical protein